MASNIFFKVHCRIGLKNLPFHQTELNLGVEEGPEAVLTEMYLRKFGDSKVFDFSFPLPENVPSERFNQVLADNLKSLRDLIINNLGEGERQVVVGGDHCLTFSSLAATLERVKDPSKLGFLHIDSHPDMLSFSESTTKNFHGMYLRPLIKAEKGVDFDIEEVNGLIKSQIFPGNMVFIGNLDIEPKEKIFFNSQGIKNITREEILRDRERVLNWFKDFVGKFEYLHVSFDVDVFDKSLVSATGIPAEHGFFWEDVEPFLKILSGGNVVTVDLAEVNPKKPGAEETISIAHQVLDILLQ